MWGIVREAPLVIIPARCGSRGVVFKNFRPLAGISPLRRALDCVEAAGFTNLVITTDCHDLEGYPFVRYVTAPLHTDTSSMLDVILDVLQNTPGCPKQRVLLVQPTQPLRQPKHLLAALEALRHTPSVATVCESEPASKLYYEYWVSVVGRGVEQRQGARRTFACDGTCYGFIRGWFLQHQHFRHPTTRMIVIPGSESCRLDSMDDWVVAEQRLRAP